MDGFELAVGRQYGTSAISLNSKVLNTDAYRAYDQRRNAYSSRDEAERAEDNVDALFTQSSVRPSMFPRYLLPPTFVLGRCFGELSMK